MRGAGNDAPLPIRVEGSLSEPGEASLIGCGDTGDCGTFVSADSMVRAIRATDRMVAILIFLVVMFVFLRELASAR